MKVLLLSIGTRGDMEPFLAVAESLRARGHEVACAFPEQFRSTCDAIGLPFYGLSPRLLELLASEDGLIVMGGKASPLRRIAAFVRLGRQGFSINAEMAVEQRTIVSSFAPDLIVHHPKAVFPILYSTQHPGKAVLLSPVPCIHHPVPGYPHVGMYNWFGKLFPAVTYWIARQGLLQNILRSDKEYLSAHQITRAAIKAQLDRHPALYGLSPAVFPAPTSWPEHVHMVGFQERNQQQHWEPSESLKGFMDRHERVLLLSFGSMSNPEPERITGLFMEALQKLGIPAIINCAWGGLQKSAQYDEGQFCFVEGIPYDWAFPRVYAVIHHGGAGTTQTALKYGCAAMIIPHIIDQFLWNDINHALGAGPKGQSIRQLKAARLQQDIYDLWHNPGYRQSAKVVAQKMAQEDAEATCYDQLVQLSKATQTKSPARGQDN